MPNFIPRAAQAPFDIDLYNVAVRSEGLYEAGCNFFWQNSLFTTTPSVPVNEIAVRKLMEQHFPSGPARFPWALVVGVPSDDYNPLEHKGSLQKASPEEMGHAFILAIARDIEQGVDAGVLSQWKKRALSVTFVFDASLNTDDALYFKSVSLREALLSDFRAMSRTAYQRVLEVTGFKKKYEQIHGKVSASQLAQLYTQHAQMSPYSEKLTASFIDCASTIANRCLSLSRVRLALADAEAKWGHDNPLNSVYKINTIIGKAKDEQHIVWAVVGLLDVFRSGAPIDITQSALQGGHGRSLVDLFNLKYDLLQHLLNNWLDSVQLEPTVKDTLRRYLQHHDAYRAHVQAFPGEADCDMSWKLGWPKSGELALQLIERLIYTIEFDGMLKNLVRNRKSITEVLATQTIVELTGEVEKAIIMETAATAAVADVNAAAAAAASQPQSEGAGGQAGGAPSLSSSAVEPDDVAPDFKVTMAKRLLNSTVKLIAEPGTEQQLREILKSIPVVANTVGRDGKEYVGIIYDPKLSGESITAPHRRKPPFRFDKFKKLLVAALGARCPDDPKQIQPGDLVMIFDGGRKGRALIVFLWQSKSWSAVLTPFRPPSDPVDHRGLQSRSLTAFSTTDGKKRTKANITVEKITLMFDEASLKKRVQRVKGMQRQTETMMMCTRNLLVLPEKDRKHFKGSNKGDAIGPINVPDWSTSWALSFECKKELYGPNRVAVGGKGDDDAMDEGDDEGVDEVDECDDAADRDLIPPAVQSLPAGAASRKSRDDSSMEPVFYHSMFSPGFYSELIHSYNLKLIIHLTAGDGKCADACMEAKIGYVGVVFTDTHLNKLTERLTNVVLEKFGDSASSLFQPSMTAGSSTSAGGTTACQPKKEEKEKKDETKKKKKASKKKQKKGESSSSSSESGESS